MLVTDGANGVLKLMKLMYMAALENNVYPFYITKMMTFPTNMACFS